MCQMYRIALGLLISSLGVTRPLASESLIKEFQAITGSADRGPVEIVEVKDLDDILVRGNGHETRVALANVLPFSRWPKEPQDAAVKSIKAEALAFVRKQLVGKKLFAELHLDPKIEDTPVFVDILYTGKEFSREGLRWSGDRPSEKTGWGVINVNILLVERGYSPYVKTPLSRAEFQRRAEFQTAHFGVAENAASEKRIGIWKSSDLSRDLTTAARSAEVLPVPRTGQLLKMDAEKGVPLCHAQSKSRRPDLGRALRRSFGKKPPIRVGLRSLFRWTGNCGM